MPSNLPDAELVQAFLQVTADLSGQEIRRAVQGVTEHDVSRWRRDDWKRLTASKRRALLSYLDNSSSGKGEPIVLASEDQRRVAADLMALGEPGENTIRKLVGLDRYQDYLVAMGKRVPDWWYELREKVEREEL